MQEPFSLPTQGLPTAPRPRDLSVAWGRLGIPINAGRAMGRESKCLGSSPCLPHSTWCRAGSAVFTSCHSPSNTLMGIWSQAPASVTTALRLGPQLLQRGLASQLLPKPCRMRGQVREPRGGGDEPLRLTQARPGQPLWLKPQQSDQSHLLCRSSSTVLAASSTPSPGGGAANSFLFSFSFTSKKKKKVKASRSHERGALGSEVSSTSSGELPARIPIRGRGLKQSVSSGLWMWGRRCQAGVVSGVAPRVGPGLQVLRVHLGVSCWRSSSRRCWQW